MRFSILLTMGLVLVTACGGDKDEENQPAATRPAARRAAEPPRVTYPEPQVIDMLRNFDSTRVATGVVVRDRSQSESVLEFARVMRIDHRAIRRVLDSLLVQTKQTAAQNELSLALRRDGDSLVARLIAVDTGFNNTYIAHEVADHEHVLALLDTVLIRSATTPEIKKTLEQIRPAYAAHLQMARDIKAAREAAALRAASAPPPVSRPAPVVVPVDTPRAKPDSIIISTSTNN